MFRLLDAAHAEPDLDALFAMLNAAPLLAADEDEEGDEEDDEDEDEDGDEDEDEDGDEDEDEEDDEDEDDED